MNESAKGLHDILAQLYQDMLPMCSMLIGVARGIGGIGALWFIAARVWKSIAAAEPVDVYGLLRPFAIGLCILLFPAVVSLINGILQPSVIVTEAMVKGSNDAIQKYLRLKESAGWDLGALNPGNWIREFMREFLELVFEAASLCINTIRTFYLIVLAIIGPLVFGLSIYDGFQHLLTVWLAKYINVFLWLPVANIFGAIIARIQENMIRMDSISVNGVPLGAGPGFSLTDTAYLIFLLIGIVGYFTVPSVANYIVNAGGGNSFVHKVTQLYTNTSHKAVNYVSGMAADAFGDNAARTGSGMAENGVNSGYFNDKKGGR